MIHKIKSQINQRKILIILIIIFLSVFLACLFWERKSLKKDLGPKELLAENLDLPFYTKSEIIEETDSTILKSWVNSDLSRNNPIVYERVYKYKNPLQALYKYQEEYNEIFDHAESTEYYKDQLKNPVLRFNSDISDQAVFFCTLDYPKQCDSALFIGRYGQYSVRVVLNLPNYEDSNKVFESVVKQIDEEISLKLKEE